MALPANWQTVLDHLRNEPIVDSRTLVNRFNWSKVQARQVLSRMCRAQFIERIQGKRSGIYRLVTQDRNRSRVSLDDFVVAVPYHEGPYKFFWASVPREWVRRLGASVTNQRTGLKQVGFKELGSPCSAQLERNGSVRVYPYVQEQVWRPWLERELVRRGWGMDEARAFNAQLRHSIRQVEVVGPQLPVDMARELPPVTAVPEAGVVFKVCGTPKPRTFEVGLDIRQFSQFLGLDSYREAGAHILEATKLLNENMKSHVALVQDLRSESVTNRAYMENAMKDLEAQRALMENTSKLLTKLETMGDLLPSLKLLAESLLKVASRLEQNQT